MKTKLGASLIAALMMMGMFAAGAQAAPPEDKGPGPNGHNEKGLCTAYFNGQKNGHDKNDDGKTDRNPVFQQLEADSADPEDDGEEDLPAEKETFSDVFEFCDEFGIMGNPEENGRYDCRVGESREDEPRDTDGDNGDGDGEIECVRNGLEDPAENE